MVLKYTAKRPDEELDGLQALEDHFTAGAPDDVVVVGIVSRHAVAKTDPSDQWQATVRFKHVEQVTGADAEQVKQLLRGQYEKRTGNATLPLDGEDEA
ncbi:hypothetical protein [Leucobacter massiliensis]|uniref:Uncharacterized protein n=1 Tax=Leucobacter massiliensis TaxID=1686285 RepID=A0A2S9QQR4_9MICO|nr:hypothetical protein [Leucobacter massiliensis]PRI11914.1 hypothetical protein B4915_02220 [Leucobacter massiliensis]